MFGRLRVTTYAKAAGTCYGLCDHLEADARWLHRAAVEQVSVGYRPAAALISYGVNCVTSGEGSLDHPSHRIRITESCVDVVRRVIEPLSMDTFTVSIILSSPTRKWRARPWTCDGRSCRCMRT